jgi:GNAT superfamily N-acetyltransferase
MIRSMESGDKGPVLNLIEATNMFTPDEVVVAEEIIDAYLNQPHQKDYDIVVIENAEKQVTGYLSYGPTALTDGTYDLYWMAVSPGHQGKGYGKKLVEWLERKVKEGHGRMIIIETSSQPKYHPTRQFYLRLGYKEVARIPDFYKAGDDRVIYTKYI